ncbi:MAG: hypothetical protein U9P12_09610, partial [Verrucomicrobiota bacterium]|nr:hypothetical protein [Verrucomicrobiota bacterium]
VFYNGPPDEFDWMARIRDLEYETEIRGLDFGIINNNPVGTNTYAFYTNSLKYIKTYTGAPYHGSPSVWAPWSWYQSPYHFAPECALIGDPEYSYTIGVLANAIIDRIKVSTEDIIGSYWGFTDNGFGVIGGWQWGDLLPPVFDAGYLKTVSTGGDGWISQNDVSIDGNLYQTVETALAVDGGTTLCLYYQVNNGTIWHEAPSISLIVDGQTHVYSFDLQNSTPWTTGMVTAIRLEPTDSIDVSCWLDYIWIKP